MLYSTNYWYLIYGLPIALTVAVVISLPRWSGRWRRRIDTIAPYSIYRDVRAAELLVSLAAMMQAVRTAGQKQLTAAVTPLAATLVRYLFGLPFALLWLTYAGATLNFDFPDLNLTFLVSGLIAGILQIVATLLLVRLLTLRNFAVGTTFVKSEILLTAVIGYFFFTETVSALGWTAIIICVAGLFVISYSKTGRLARPRHAPGRKLAQ